ncbi:MAG: hypothetical protein J0H43_10020 [Actinobacteria bacterium]|nr:hypothetical protein [Actinomycetota bacterium]
MKFLKSFGQFWYDFIIGDDWKIAVAMVVAIGGSVALLKTDALGDHTLAILGGALIVVCFAVSLAIDVRPRKK